MKSKIFLSAFIVIAVFLLLVYYNYFQAQRAIKTHDPSAFDRTSLVPSILSSGSKGTSLACRV
jgi:hypothetical protein